jgi:hypothetical protein
VSGLWLFLGNKGLDDCGALSASIASDFNTLSLGFLDPVLVAQGGGASVTGVKDLLKVTTWAQAKGMSVTWSIGGIALKKQWGPALSNGGAAAMAAEMGALANAHKIGWELDCEDDTDHSADYNALIAKYRTVVPKGDPVKTLTINVAGSSYRGDSSGYLGWIGKVAKDPVNVATLDRVIVMVAANVTSDAAWRQFWTPSVQAYGAARTLVSRKIDTPRCGVADIGTTASYVVSTGLAGMFTWGVAACHTDCSDCLSQQKWASAQAAGQCKGLETASKLVMA